MAEGHISWGTWLGPRAYDHLCVWEALPSLLPSRRGFIALAQKSNTNIDIINHNILRGKAKAFQIITNNTWQEEDEVLQHFNLPLGHHLNGGYLSI